MILEYESAFDKKECVAVVTGLENKSKNRKTGNVAQMWFLLKNQHPCEAVKDGSDYSICGDCPQRWSNGGGCYVIPHMGPSGIWKNLSKYKIWNIKEGINKIIRVGAYGDPASIPEDIWKKLFEPLLKKTKSLSYTHSWRAANHLRKQSMASVETLDDAMTAQLRGWKTARIIKNIAEVTKKEVLCSNQTKKTLCETCKLCDGKSVNVCFLIHGTKKNQVKVGE